MFKKGDVIICIDEDGYTEKYLTIGKEYFLYKNETIKALADEILIRLNEGTLAYVSSKLFMSELEYRKQKIEKIRKCRNY